MAKIALTKLGLKSNTEIKTIEWNGQNIEVKQYLPIEAKLDLISDIANKSLDDNPYYNPARIKIFIRLEIILAYANINTTDKTTLFSNISKQLNLTETELETEINNLLSYFDKDEEEIVYSVYYYGFNKIVQYELGTVDNKDMIQYKIEDKESIKLFSEGTCFVS